MELCDLVLELKVCKQKWNLYKPNRVCCKTWAVPVKTLENMEYDLLSIFQGLKFKWTKMDDKTKEG